MAGNYNVKRLKWLFKSFILIWKISARISFKSQLRRMKHFNKSHFLTGVEVLNSENVHKSQRKVWIQKH